MAVQRRTAVDDEEMPENGDQYAHGGMRSALAFLFAACWDDTADPAAVSLEMIAKAMGARYAGLDKEAVKQSICAAFRSDHAPSGEDLDALNLDRPYVPAAFKTDLTRLSRLKGEALQRAYIGLNMWAPPTSAIENVDGDWGAINEAAISLITQATDDEIHVKANDYLFAATRSGAPERRHRSTTTRSTGIPTCGSRRLWPRGSRMRGCPRYPSRASCS